MDADRISELREKLRKRAEEMSRSTYTIESFYGGGKPDELSRIEEIPSHLQMLFDREIDPDDPGVVGPILKEMGHDEQGQVVGLGYLLPRIKRLLRRPGTWGPLFLLIGDLLAARDGQEKGGRRSTSVEPAIQATIQATDDVATETTPATLTENQGSGEKESANSANTSSLFCGSVPNNPKLVQLINQLDAERNKPEGERTSERQIALKITDGNKNAAESLKAQKRKLVQDGKVNL